MSSPMFESPSLSLPEPVDPELIAALAPGGPAHVASEFCKSNVLATEFDLRRELRNGQSEAVIYAGGNPLVELKFHPLHGFRVRRLGNSQSISSWIVRDRALTKAVRQEVEKALPGVVSSGRRVLHPEGQSLDRGEVIVRYQQEISLPSGMRERWADDGLFASTALRADERNSAIVTMTVDRSGHVVIYLPCPPESALPTMLGRMLDCWMAAGVMQDALDQVPLARTRHHFRQLIEQRAQVSGQRQAPGFVDQLSSAVPVLVVGDALAERGYAELATYAAELGSRSQTRAVPLVAVMSRGRLEFEAGYCPTREDSRAGSVWGRDRCCRRATIASECTCRLSSLEHSRHWADRVKHR